MKIRIVRFLLAVLAFCVVSGAALSASKEIGPEKWRISCFAYRDDNRNGLYDMADRPYGGLVVQIERPDGLVVQAKSNISGFANFNMALGNEEKGQIYEAGVHKAKAVPPNGWVTTSEARLQEITFVERKNAGGRMVAGNNCVPMGVAPVLFIGGSVKRKTPDQNISVSVIPEGLGEVKLRLDDLGNYYTVVKPGRWRVRVVDEASGVTIEREVHVKSHPVVLSKIVEFSEPNAADKPVSTVSFDDLTSSDTLHEIPSGYGGLFWWNWIATHHKFYRGSGYVNGTISAEYIAYNSSGHPAVMWTEKGETFDFLGTYISVAWPRAENDFIYVKAWRGETLRHTDKLRLETSGSVYFLGNYEGITRLEFTSGNYERIVLDDFSFRK
ncbi:MAG: hypothetical protein GY948_01325 [Alphaproteobacteria bacterium]|nr:hypothetical protein [Alphaproteobacteria bacterium]